MPTKTCASCKKELSPDDFWKEKAKPDGLRTICKVCAREYKIKWALENPETYLLQRIRRREKQSEYFREWYAKNGRSRIEGYTESIKEWVRKNPEKIMAHKLVKSAVHIGFLTRPIECSECSRETKVFAHHDDYSQPLNVRWLCGSCHKLFHTAIDREAAH